MNLLVNVLHPKGKYQEKEHPKVVSRLCEWCPFNGNEKLCNKH